MGDQRVRAMSVAGSEGNTRIVRSSRADHVGDHAQPAGRVLGLEERLPLREAEGSQSRQRPREVRRVLRQVAARRLAVDLEQRLAVGVVHLPGRLVDLRGHRLSVLLELGDVADRIGATGVEPLELDPVQPDRHQLEGAVGERLDLGHLHPAADPEQPLSAVVADLVALADADRAEDPLGGVVDAEQVVDEGAVAVLEDSQGHAHAGEEHGVEREHRERVTHVLRVVVRSRFFAPPGSGPDGVSARPSTPGSAGRGGVSARAQARFAARCGRPPPALPDVEVCRLARKRASPLAAAVHPRLRRTWRCVGSRASALRRSLRPSTPGSAGRGRPRST